MQIFYLNITNSDSLIEFSDSSNSNSSLDQLKDVGNKTSIKFVKSFQKKKNSSSKAKNKNPPPSSPINLETASNESEVLT